MLAVHGDAREACGVRKTAWPAGTGLIGEATIFFDATFPAVHGLLVTFGEYGNGPRVDVLHAQGHHVGSPLNLLLNQGASRGCVERFGKRRQSAFHAQAEGDEVFFTTATSWGRDCLICPNPIRAR